jgi:hypothetical protein
VPVALTLVAVHRVTALRVVIGVAALAWLQGVRSTLPSGPKGAFSQLLADLESSAWEGIDVARRSNALA